MLLLPWLLQLLLQQLLLLLPWLLLPWLLLPRRLRALLLHMLLMPLVVLVVVVDAKEVRRRGAEPADGDGAELARSLLTSLYIDD